MVAITAVAMTGVIALSSKGIDVFSTCAMGSITALDGGTIRDLVQGVPVSWSADLNHVRVALAASGVAVIRKPLLDRRHPIRLDAFGAGVVDR